MVVANISTCCLPLVGICHLSVWGGEMRREAAATPGLERSRRQLLRQRALFLVASRPRLPGQWVFFSPGRYRKLQTCANQAAPLSLTLSKLLIAPVGGVRVNE